MTRSIPELQPLLQALYDLHSAYTACVARAEDLVSALVSGDFMTVQRAVAAQAGALAPVEHAERRRQAAEANLVRALSGRSPAARASGITTTALLKLLPADEAARLAKVRHDLLTTLVRLQTVNRQAATLTRNAQAVLRHTIGATGAATGYGPSGERTLLGQNMRRLAGRRA